MVNKKLTEKDYDERGFQDALKLAEALRVKGSEKTGLLKKAEDVYLMRWSPKKGTSDLKVTVSPDGKNKLKGAVRLLTAAVPKFRVPREKNNLDVEQVSSDLEMMAQTMWLMSNHVQGVRVERDLALSGFLYDEIILNVICLKDVVDNLSQKPKEIDKWEEMRWESRLEQAKKYQAMTPYMFEMASPMVAHPQYGRFGVEMIYNEVKRRVADVKGLWGADAYEAIGSKKDSDEVTECTLMDTSFKYVWLAENKSKPIYAGILGLPMMPTVAVRAEGTRLFDKTTDQYDPFLKTMAESGLWDLQNNILTATRTNIVATLNAQWVFKQGQIGDVITPMHEVFLGLWSAPPGSSLEPLAKDALSKDVIGAMELVRAMNSESTIYDAALGAGAGKGDPYGLVSLMSQAGRLPLIGVQKMLGEALAKAMEITFTWMKENGDGTKVSAKYGKDLELKASDIPDVIRFECDVDIDLPQDKLSMLSAGKAAVEMGASQEWALSEFAGIENPEAMRKQKVKEQAWDAVGPWVVQQVMKVVEGMMKPSTPPPAPPQPGTVGEGGMPPVDMASMPTQPPTEGMMPQGGPPAPQTPRGQPTPADMAGGGMPMPPEMGGM